MQNECSHTESKQYYCVSCNYKMCVVCFEVHCQIEGHLEGNPKILKQPIENQIRLIDEDLNRIRLLEKKAKQSEKNLWYRR